MPAALSLTIPLASVVGSLAEIAVQVKIGTELVTWFPTQSTLLPGGLKVRVALSPESRFWPLTVSVRYVGRHEACTDQYQIRPAPEDPVAETATPPVVVIHGWQWQFNSCHEWRTTWNPDSFGGPLFAHLNARGLGARATYWRYTYPTFNSVDEASQDLARELEDMFPNRDDVVIVAHSMGGLVARAAIELYGADRHVRRVITLGTPHNGTAAAKVDFWGFLSPALGIGTPGSQDLAPADGSNFISRLRAAQSDEGTTLYYALAGDLAGAQCGLTDCPHYFVIDKFFRASGSASDGIVPVPSATWWDYIGPLRQEVFTGYDHTSMHQGKSPAPDDNVLKRVATLVEEAVTAPALRVIFREPVLPARVHVSGNEVFWSEWGGCTPGCGRIRKMPKIGGPVTTLADNLVYAYDFVIQDGYLYFSDGNSASPGLKRVSVNGGPIRSISRQGGGGPAILGEYVYVTSGGAAPQGGVVLRARTDGQNVVMDTVVRGLKSPRLVRSSGSRIYILDQGNCPSGCQQNTGAIWEYDPARQSVLAIATGLTYPRQLTFDEQYVYFTHSGVSGPNGMVSRVPIGGGAVTNLVTGLSEPTAVVTDGRFLYFTEWNRTVKRLDLASGGVLVLETDQDAGEATGNDGLALDGTSLFWSRFWRGKIVKLTPR